MTGVLYFSSPVGGNGGSLYIEDLGGKIKFGCVLVKSFCGGPGGNFFKKRPLVAEGTAN